MMSHRINTGFVRALVKRGPVEIFHQPHRLRFYYTFYFSQCGRGFLAKSLLPEQFGQSGPIESIASLSSGVLYSGPDHGRMG